MSPRYPGPTNRLIPRSSGRALGFALVAFALLAAATVAAGAAAPEARSAPSRPNFVVIMSDDQTVGELSSMHRTLAKVGARGVSFDRFITSYPLCCPSRTTFLTGQYSHNHG